MTDQQQKNGKVYDDALSKGQRLLDILRIDNLGPQSHFLDTEAFEHWGYTGARDAVQMKRQALLHIQGKLGVDKASNRPMYHCHTEDTFDGRCPATRAEFSSIINPAGGMIVAVENRSPTQQTMEGWEADSILPELEFWSDIVYLQWLSVARDTKSLKYIVRLGIVNSKTTAVIDHIMASNEYEEQYPG
jgi:hypothetical protein